MDNGLALARKEVMANLGRNIVMFQSVENIMKRLAPLFTVGGMVGSDGVMGRYIALSKRPLGIVVKEFLRNSGLREIPEVRAQYAMLVKQRNALVHHFNEVHGKALETKQGCSEVIAHLKAQFEVIKEFRGHLLGLAAGINAILCETQFAGTPEYADFRALCDQLVGSVDPKYLPEFTIEPA